MAASDRRQKLLLRGTAAAIIVGVVAFGMSNVSALRNLAQPKAGSKTDSAALAVRPETISSSTPADSIVAQGAPTSTPAPVVTPPTVATPTPTPTRDATVSPPPSVPTLAPIVHVGDTSLGSGVTATRSDTGVVVAFDNPEWRTRTGEKFERLLRQTLPQVYGAPIEAPLAAVGAGKLVAQDDLLSTLPTRGLRLPLDAGWHLEVFPETRAGADGPLVVRYRSRVVKDSK